MPTQPAALADRPLRGVLLVMAAVLLFACHDTVIKYLVASYQVPLVAAIRYIVNCLLMVAILAPRHGRQLVQTKRTGLVIVRGLCLVAASLCMGLGLQRIPVAEATSLIFLAPMVLMIVARPILGETVDRFGWVAALLGLAGVLIIVRPGSGLDPIGVAYVLGAMAASVVYYLLSRVLASTESTAAMTFYTALAGSICFGIFLPWTWSGPTPSTLEVGLFLSLGVTAGAGHFLFTAAHRHAPASLLAPINYLQLVWAGLLSWVVFAHVPDGLTILGMGVVAASGVMIALKSSRRAKQPIPEPAQVESDL